MFFKGSVAIAGACFNWLKDNLEILPDIQETEEIQIIPVNVIGEWDFKTDVPYFILENKEEIKRTFEKICDTFDLSIDE